MTVSRGLVFRTEPMGTSAGYKGHGRRGHSTVHTGQGGTTLEKQGGLTPGGAHIGEHGAAIQDRGHQRQVKGQQETAGPCKWGGPPHSNAGNSSYRRPRRIKQQWSSRPLLALSRENSQKGCEKKTKSHALGCCPCAVTGRGGSSTNLPSLVSLLHADNARDQLG